MFIIIAPSKTQTLDVKEFPQFSLPEFPAMTANLISKLRQYSREELGQLMKMSDKLAEQNFTRFQEFSSPSSLTTGKQALFVFQGDVYSGIEAEQYTDEELAFCQNHLRILSGLYGILRPLDLMIPYRLEMGLKWKIEEKNLYQFWKEDVTASVNREAEGQPIINLASNEYFKVLDKKLLKSKIITPAFKEQTEKGLKTVAIYAKRARGKMANFIIRNKLNKPEQLLAYNEDGYCYNEEVSTEKEMVFSRKKV